MLIEQKEKYQKLGLNIAYYRKQHGLSQDKLAELIDISRQHLSFIESGNGSVSLDVVFKICDVLSVSPKNLFDFRD